MKIKRIRKGKVPEIVEDPWIEYFLSRNETSSEKPKIANYITEFTY